jgi:hypothetical protein
MLTEFAIVAIALPPENCDWANSRMRATTQKTNAAGSTNQP